MTSWKPVMLPAHSGRWCVLQLVATGLLWCSSGASLFVPIGIGLDLLIAGEPNLATWILTGGACLYVGGVTSSAWVRRMRGWRTSKLRTLIIGAVAIPATALLAVSTGVCTASAWLSASSRDEMLFELEELVLLSGAFTLSSAVPALICMLFLASSRREKGRPSSGSEQEVARRGVVRHGDV